MKRFYEIDFMRGFAIILMIFYHFFFDLKLFGVIKFESFLFWWLFPRLIGFLFIFIVGISLSISYSRISKKSEKEKIKKYLIRGIKILSLGSIITIVTWIFAGENFIIFGILHLIGTSVLIAYPFLKYKKLNLFLGIILFISGWFLQQFRFSFNWLLWAGFIPKGFQTLDYYPLIPWFGVVLMGIFFGKNLYSVNKRKFSMKKIENIFTKFTTTLGRNSLLIYMIHQPFLVSIILASFYISNLI